jgi:hypothetical protein
VLDSIHEPLPPDVPGELHEFDAVQLTVKQIKLKKLRPFSRSFLWLDHFAA